ncbi:LysR family transcriptional regulator [Actinopolymorpha sp. B11F2]|uniref:LysR family transcriptional regulator n=1 Tax=Actinopolymorpha sp. B11F2 TaxID=3160862 RepID=UPI0032E49A00
MIDRDMLEADALRSFAVFAEHRNFTAAATALRISQPSLHVKIKKLAAALGVDLYERSGRALTLTAAGERLAAFALDSHRRLDDFLGDLHGTSRPLGIAAGRGALRWVIAEAIRRISTTGRSISVLTSDRESAISALSAGHVDLAVIAHDPPPPQFDSRQIASYPQVLVIDVDHPLSNRDDVSLLDLDGLELVLPASGRPHRRTLERALADVGASWRVTAEVDGWDLLVHCTALGIGATIVNGCVAVPDGLAAIPVTDLPKIRYWAAWRSQRRTHVNDLITHLATP